MVAGSKFVVARGGDPFALHVKLVVWAAIQWEEVAVCLCAVVLRRVVLLNQTHLRKKQGGQWHMPHSLRLAVR